MNRSGRLAGPLLVCILGVSFPDLTSGRELYRCDFASSGQCRIDGGWRVTLGGRGIRKTEDAYGTWSPLGVPDLSERSFSMLFEVREFDRPGKDPHAGHWGFESSNAHGDKMLLFSHITGFNYITRTSSGQQLGADYDHSRIPMARAGNGAGAAGAWSKVRLTVDRHGYRLFVDGRLCRSAHQSLGPMAGLVFHCFGREVEIRDFRIEEEHAKAPNFQEEPTFVREGPVTSICEFAVTNLVSSAGGGVSFWFNYVPGTDCLRLVDGRGRSLANFGICGGDRQFLAQIAMAGSEEPISYKRIFWAERGRTTDETVHLAFTWNEKGEVRFFVNGLPYSTVGFAVDNVNTPIDGNLLDDAWKVVFPLENHRQRVLGAKIWRRPLSNADVLSEYRRRMPVDLVVNESVYEAGVPVNVAASIAPGGHYMRPHPVPGTPPVRANVDLELRIERLTGDFTGEPVSDGVTHLRGVDVSEAKDVRSNPVTFERPGDYRLIVRVTPRTIAGRRVDAIEPYVRTLFFTVARPLMGASRSNKEKWQRGELLFERRFDRTNAFEFAQGVVRSISSLNCGTYLETGSVGSLDGDRAGTVVGFPGSAFGHPCLLEVVWPDDKPRVMGLCMHPETTTNMNRDRLMAGIVAGDKFRNRQALRSTEYLFFPSRSNYLFEVRTLVKDRPGAISALRAWRLKEPLPRLEVRHPDGFPHRRFGHQDEDQTFNLMLNADSHGGVVGGADELLRYFAYTGESTFQYSFLRYTTTFASLEGGPDCCAFAGKNGELSWLASVLESGGVEFIGQFCLYGDPLIARSRLIDCDWRERGFYTLDSGGRDRPAFAVRDYNANIANPELQDLLFSYFGDYLSRNARSGAFKGVEIPVTLYGKWTSPEHGYDDWTVGRFATTLSKDDIPDILIRPARVSSDYAARYDLLWKGGLRTRWLRWRADRVTEFFARLVAFVNKTCPRLKVYLSLPDCGDWYEKNGVDIDALMRIKGAGISLNRQYNENWFDLYRRNEVNDKFERQYDSSSGNLGRILSTRGHVDLFRSGQAYFETFRKTLCPQRFGGYFQDLDVKPVGRDFLKELSFGVGACDALDMTCGGQQLGTLGVEDFVREFVQAYSALPAMPFTEIKGSDVRAVVARAFAAQDGTYFYLVNMTDESQEVSVIGLEDAVVTDLSSDRPCQAGAYALQPYQLRSFFTRGKQGLKRLSMRRWLQR